VGQRGGGGGKGLPGAWDTREQQQEGMAAEKWGRGLSRAKLEMLRLSGHWGSHVKGVPGIENCSQGAGECQGSGGIEGAGRRAWKG